MKYNIEPSNIEDHIEIYFLEEPLEDVIAIVGNLAVDEQGMVQFSYHLNKEVETSVAEEAISKVMLDVLEDAVKSAPPQSSIYVPDNKIILPE